MGVNNEGNPSETKPYRRPHYQESLQERKEDLHQHHEGRRWNNQQYSWNRASHNHYLTRYYQRPTNWRSHQGKFYNERNQTKENFTITNYLGLRPKRIEFGLMDHHQWQQENMHVRKSYYLVSSHVKPLNTKLWGQSFEKEGIIIWPWGGHIRASMYMQWGKCKCNSVGLIEGPHVIRWGYVYIEVNIVIMGHVIWGYMNILNIWRSFSYSLRSYCITHLSYLLWSCDPRSILCTLVYYCILRIWFLTFLKSYQLIFGWEHFSSTLIQLPWKSFIF